MARIENWNTELREWLSPFLQKLGHKARRQMCPLYVSGLIGPGDRKSVQPMAERLAPGDYDQLHHFVAAGVWDAAPLEAELLIQADRLVGGSDAVLVIDDTAMPKKGKHSVGVAPQYASALGKTANCQTLVSLTLARGEVPVMVALRLFLPRELDERSGPLEADRCSGRTSNCTNEAGDRPGGDRSHDRSRCPLRLCTGGCRLRMSAPFRQGLTARNLAWAVGIPRHLKVYPVGVKLIWPKAARGRPRQRHIPDILSMAAEDMLADIKWQTISWRTGTKGKLKARFAAVRVCTADGPPQRIRTRASSICRRRGLAHRRKPDVRREEILSRQPTRRNGPAQLGCHDQGAMDLRAGPSATERRIGPRPLRGKILERPSPSRSHDDDRLRLPPTSPSHKSEAGKKESTDPRLSRACQPCATPSPSSWFDCRHQRCPHCRRWISAGQQRE